MFLEMWACKDMACFGAVESAGRTGHGWAWQDIAFALERECDEEGFLGLEVDLGRTESLALEVLGWGGDLGILDPKMVRERWGIEWGRLLRDVEELRQRRE